VGQSRRQRNISGQGLERAKEMRQREIIRVAALGCRGWGGVKSIYQTEDGNLGA
jgi:hypothetical protein